MIDALIAGKFYGQPVQKTGMQGKPFAISKVRAAAGDGEGLFVNVISFEADTVTALLPLVSNLVSVTNEFCRFSIVGVQARHAGQLQPRTP
jgi:hypothetical protein